MAREQLIRTLSGRRVGPEQAKVWCWEDAWEAVAREQDEVPARLSPSARRVVLAEAIGEARRDGRLDRLAGLVDYPGYRRQLTGRMASWTIEERPINGALPGGSEASAEEWAVFQSYRQILHRLDAEDPAGWAVWASRMLAKRSPPELRKPGNVVVVEPIGVARAGWRLLDHCHQRARSMTITLPFVGDSGLAELHAATDETRRQFLGWGFIEEAERTDEFAFRPRGLVAIERELFRSDGRGQDSIRLDRDDGLTILGGPEGEGISLLVARQVRAHLDRGAHPDEILILVPRIDDAAGRIRETLRSWALPVDEPPSVLLSTIPEVSALRLALRLEAEDWDVATLVQLLRNQQVRLPGLDDGPGLPRHEAALAIRATRVFRGRTSLEQALARDAEDPSRAGMATIALRAVRQIGQAVRSTPGPARWSTQVARARRTAEALAINRPGLEPLWDALDDQTWILERLGPAVSEEAWEWGDFVERVSGLALETETPGSEAQPGTIRLVAISDSYGARARFVILANLGERSFPEPSAIDVDQDLASTPADATPDLRYSREMLRFVRAASTAEEHLTLCYPTSDAKGEPLLPAGFLDDLIRRLEPTSATTIVEKHARLDPVLKHHADLAGSPVDARVRALALALAPEGEGDEPLRELASNAGHRDALLVAADALEAAHRRRVEKSFGPYDGRIEDPRVIAEIGRRFGPDHSFSASQLESFATCPFQFYQRYVLGLKMIDERLELDDDYAAHGTNVHDVLEQLHQQIAAEEDGSVLDRLNVLIRSHVRVELGPADPNPAPIPEVLREIAQRRTERALVHYLDQFHAYTKNEPSVPTPHRFEVSFGESSRNGAPKPGSLPHLVLGEGDGVVKLQGKIDRIDLVRDEQGRVGFRVIDYKTGSKPSGRDVKTGLASQLPLYALAVEQLIFPDGDRSLGGIGYWSLGGDGYKPIRIKEWPAYRELLMDFIVDLVGRLREGHFPIASQKDDCRKHCDYHAACRVTEVRGVGKVWADRPSLEGPV